MGVLNGFSQLEVSFMKQSLPRYRLSLGLSGGLSGGLLAGLLLMANLLGVSCASRPLGSGECSAAREYVTVLEYLRDQKHFGSGEAESRSRAERVALFCEGAAKRFIETVETLQKAGVDPARSLMEGELSAKGSSISAQAFLRTFRALFARDGYDLTLPEALQAARSLAAFGVEAEQERVTRDFEELGAFCSQGDPLLLSKPQCAALAVRLARQVGGKQSALTRELGRFYRFLRASEPGPGLTLTDALSLAEKVLPHGESAGESFKAAYLYATTASGLGLSSREGLAFALKLAEVRKKALTE